LCDHGQVWDGVADMLLDELGDGGGIGHPWSLIVKDEGGLVHLVDQYDQYDTGCGLGKEFIPEDLVSFWGYPHPGLESLCRGQFFSIGYRAPHKVISIAGNKGCGLFWVVVQE
jgi:hypothetical protein